MFGKDFSPQIQNLYEADNAIVKQLNKNTEKLDEMIKHLNELQEQVILIAQIQSQHKEAIGFLMRNATVDSDDVDKVQKDLMKMLKNINNTNDKFDKVKDDKPKK